MPSSAATTNNTSITLTTRHDRSLLTALLHLLIRPFRVQLNSSKPDPSSGSPVLTPPRSVPTTHRTICDINIYDIHPQSSPSNTTERNRIYYIAGGSWQQPPSSQHWWLCKHISQQLPNTTVSIISAPLAPNNPASKSFPWLMQLYTQLMRTSHQNNEKVIWIGDSSGANIILSLIMETLRLESSHDGNDRQQEKEKKIPRPISALVISPSTDLTRSNPRIHSIVPHDPFMTPSIIKATAAAWLGEDVSASDPIVSPIYGNFKFLGASGIKIHGVTAGYDVLSPDGVVYREKLEENKVEGIWLHWERQMHCFVLTAKYGLREGREGVEWIIDVLRKDLI